MRTQNLSKQYDKLTASERAHLMIQAELRGDDSEFQRLKQSAQWKCFKLLADEECEITTSWQKAHINYLLLRQNLKLQNLTFYLARIHDSITDLTESEADRHACALELAFVHLLAKKGLPMNKALLESFGCLPESTGQLEPETQRIHDNYLQILNGGTL